MISEEQTPQQPIKASAQKPVHPNGQWQNMTANHNSVITKQTRVSKKDAHIMLTNIIHMRRISENVSYV